jgi:DNA-binding NarL/FixJ family response regulator
MPTRDAPIDVLLADDHVLVRAGIRALLEDLGGLRVVAEANDGREAEELVAKHRPDVVLMDIGMKGLNGLEATAHITREHPNTRVIILSVHSSEEYVLRAMRAGAAGYLLKDSATHELRLAIDAVMHGQNYLSPPISRQVIDRYIRRLGADLPPSETLTGRQREILQLISEGRSTKEIAHQLKLSVKTVEAHRTRIMERLDIHDVPGLVRYAIRTGLTSVEN